MNREVVSRTNDSYKEVVAFAFQAGLCLLENGADTGYVEEKITNICKFNGYNRVNAFVTPTVIILGQELNEGKCLIKRVESVSTNLEKVAEASMCIRNYKNGKYSIKEAKREMNDIYTKVNTSAFIQIAGAGLASACFTSMFLGNFADFTGGLITGCLSMILYLRACKYTSSPFTTFFVAGFSLGVIGYYYSLIAHTSVDKVITGAVMPYVPGLILTNGIKDFISGDMLSGTSRFFEALMDSIIIGFGVITSMRLVHFIGGLL